MMVGGTGGWRFWLQKKKKKKKKRKENKKKRKIWFFGDTKMCKEMGKIDGGEKGQAKKEQERERKGEERKNDCKGTDRFFRNIEIVEGPRK